MNVKVVTIEIKYYQLKNIFNENRTNLQDIINDLKRSDVWQIQLTISVNCICSKDNKKEHMMHSKNDKKEIVINDKADEVIEELFQ